MPPRRVTRVEAREADSAGSRNRPADEAGEAGVGDSRTWLWVTSLTIVAAGLAVSGYLTYAHFTNPAVLACPGTSVVNCEKVTTSAQSHILGVPVAVLGLVFFFAMGMASSPVAWAAKHPVIRYGRLLLAVTGVGMVCYLVYTELFTLDAICLWCTGVHLLTLALFAVVVLGTVLTLPDPV